MWRPVSGVGHREQLDELEGSGETSSLEARAVRQRNQDNKLADMGHPLLVVLLINFKIE